MKAIKTEHAPAAIGPYSQGVSAAGFVFTSGQIALTANGEFCGATIETEVRQVMENLRAILKASSLSFEQVIKSEIYLVDLDDFSVVNEIYQSFLNPPFPARITVGVKALPKGARVEISMMALQNNK